MSEREFLQWKHYLEHEPPAVDRLELYLAQLTAVTLNATGRLKRPASAKDFLIPWGPKPKQTVSDMVGRFRAAVDLAKSRTALAKRRADALAKRRAAKGQAKPRAPRAPRK